MIKDKNKDIINIEYNHLNLPKKIDFETNDPNTFSGKYIRYFYDATGVKLAKSVQEENVSGLSYTFYNGAYIYEKSSGSSTTNLKFISQPEGYIEPDNQGGFDYVYQFKDHLDNIRLSYIDSDGNGSIDSNTEIVEENNYYPFGLKHKGYNNVVSGSEYKYETFNGKEIEESLGLNVYEMDWRQYDASIGRFNIIDSYAEFMYDQTPYHFSYNSPIYNSDPIGLCPNGDCSDIGDNMEGDATLSDCVTWVVSQGVWTRNDGMLDEVTVVAESGEPEGPPTEEEAKAKDEQFEAMCCFTSWGTQRRDTLGSWGRGKGATSVSVDYNDIAPKGSNSSKMGKVWDISNYFYFWPDYFMPKNNDNKEPTVTEPVVITYQAQGQLKENARHGLYPEDSTMKKGRYNYGGIGVGWKTQDKAEAKKDSAGFSKTNYFEKIWINVDTTN